MTTELSAKHMYVRAVQAQKDNIMDKIKLGASMGLLETWTWVHELSPQTIKYLEGLGYRLNIENQGTKYRLEIQWDMEKPED